MRALSFLALLVLVAGCLNGDYNDMDASVPVPDLAQPKIYDLAGVDLSGAYNCSALNQCERNCTTKVCVFMCRNMATPQARDKDDALQSCFKQYCPTDPGKVCAPDMNGMVSMACMVCLANTYLPQNQDCSPTQLPSECHMCLAEANACTADM